MRHGVGHPFADLLLDAVASALHAMPFAAHDRAANPHPGHVVSVGARGEYADLLRSPGFPEVIVAKRPGGEIEGRRMDEHGR